MRKYSRHIAIIVCIAILTGVLTACGSVKSTQNQEVVTFTDALGREVSVPKEPERVVALIGSFADIWILAGGDLCAAAEDAWEDFELDLPDAVNIGGAHSPNLELIFSADPDFVIASASTSSNVEMKETLEAAGITVAYFDVDDFEDYLAMLDVCTDITGRKDLYEKNGLEIQSRIEEVKRDMEEQSLLEERRKVLLLRAHSGSVKAKGSEGTILGEMLANLGCINIADSDASLLETLSIESIIRQKPYRIFVVTMGNDSQKALDNLYKMMDENPAWGSLEAVAEGRIHLMDRRLFHNKPNADWAVAYEKLSEILHSE
jgi:iron complex transport system substrate-binding protein